MKLGLVLAGGGGKGAYQIGVMKALAELDLMNKIEAIAGTSVGALNAALFVNQNIMLAEQMWRTISPNKILSIKDKKVTSVMKDLLNAQQLQRVTNYTKRLEGFGVFSREGLLKMIEESIDLTAVSTATIPFYVTCTAIPEWQATYFQMNGLDSEKMKQILLASSAIPGVFSSVTIEEQCFIDGGFVDNAPIKPLYELGCDVIIVILLDRAAMIQKAKFPNANIFEIVPQRKQGNVLTGTLNFDGIRANLRMQEGYEDAMAILQPVVNMRQNERAFLKTAQQIVVEEQSFKRQHNQSNRCFQQSVQVLTDLIERDE